ncbi:hypothetical protein BHM03_00034380 [Ensete ventricosum]|nr:hypothetical protein BHM03_00034380 [Ensete ventricosum]
MKAYRDALAVAPEPSIASGETTTKRQRSSRFLALHTLHVQTLETYYYSLHCTPPDKHDNRGEKAVLSVELNGNRMRVGEPKIPALVPEGVSFGHAARAIGILEFRTPGVAESTAADGVNGDEEDENDDIEDAELVPVHPHLL